MDDDTSDSASQPAVDSQPAQTATGVLERGDALDPVLFRAWTQGASAFISRRIADTPPPARVPWGDPWVRVLEGKEWDAVCEDVLAGLGLDAMPVEEHLAALVSAQQRMAAARAGAEVLAAECGEPKPAPRQG
ncbi:hypothetical protein [Streptomyces minutiscleroticus]|uniref:Uncharacterized protein n=2 Tax=Streptomyces minutiscleroticus TaxID=68238 RepID=A0A918U9K8_9ACTN|nr:hypothetical protein GCM10010358_80150 [Streptomyces minutiscleroticus]